LQEYVFRKISSDNFNQQVQLSNDILNLQQQLQTRIYAPIKGLSVVLKIKVSFLQEYVFRCADYNI
jgi:hypothetical protein